jgi:hypothetical protein|tara:strand:+ start:115 stop:489 length:375 start_codon:yes stop_codon:yes gene_type:complete
MEKKLRKSFIFLPAITVIVSACSGPDVSTRVTSSLSSGVPAIEQKVQGKAIIMTPNVEDITDKSFNIRYMELSFGSGVPETIRDLAIDQCASTGKVAVFMGNTRGLVQFNTVKAHYECREIQSN